jgi:hypothetical protein
MHAQVWEPVNLETLNRFRAVNQRRAIVVNERQTGDPNRNGAASVFGTLQS